jgi:hypothetical protein
MYGKASAIACAAGIRIFPPRSSNVKSVDLSRDQEPDLISLFVAPLEAVGISAYMISGSIASIEYGEPRATLDIDIVLLLASEQVAQLAGLFPAPDYYLPPEDVVYLEIQRPARGHFNIIHVPSGLKADCYPSRSHPCLSWALSHRRRVRLMGIDVWMAPPEYVILWKLEFYREGREEKHLRDIRGILQVSGEELDRTFLEENIAALGLREGWLLCVG